MSYGVGPDPQPLFKRIPTSLVMNKVRFIVNISYYKVATPINTGDLKEPIYHHDNFELKNACSDLNTTIGYSIP